MRYFIRLLIIVFLLCNVNSCIFSPKTGEKGTTPTGQWETPTTPRKVVNNLQVAFDRRDVNLYERCLHENYFYISPSYIDSLDINWPRSDDVRAVENVMNNCTKIVFTPLEISIVEEYGKDVPNIPDGKTIVDDHPTEIWWVCTYYVTMDVFTKDYGEMLVKQDMKYKMVEDTATHYYSIIRWIDETPEGSAEKYTVQ
jgi:hypothetical protein